MEKRIKVLLILIFISAVALIFLFSNTFSFTGNIIKDSIFPVGENLTGDLVVVLRGGDELSSSSPILISLTKGDEVIKTETLTFGEFVLASGAEEKDVYDVSGSFSVNLEDFIQYQFDEVGSYELLFSVLELDFNKREVFIVY